jgi:hypothetical protein
MKTTTALSLAAAMLLAAPRAYADADSGLRLGLQGVYTILPEARFAPWAGVSVGYERLRYASATVSGKESEIGFRGFEAGVQVGADDHLGSSFSVGPFAAFDVGQFQSQMTWVSGAGETATDVAAKGVHEWLQLGIEGSFNL